MSSNRSMIRISIEKHQPLWLVLLFLAVAQSCSQKPEELTFIGDTMGTRYHVKLIAAHAQADRDLIQSRISGALDAVDQAMSNWKPESDISRFNRSAPNESTAIGKDTARVMAMAFEVHRTTDGAFDPTIGPLIELWGFGTRENNTKPHDDEIQTELKKTGLSNVIHANGTLSKQVEGLQINLSAIAKGYAVDKVAEALVELGHPNFMVEVGGEVRAAGKNLRGEPWLIGIERPEDSGFGQSIYKGCTVENKALATSGDYRIYFTYEGQKYSHIIDPRTGNPIPAYVTSVSVMADECALADGLATGLMILDPARSVAIVERLAGVECLILARSEDGALKEFTSSGMNNYLKELPKR